MMVEVFKDIEGYEGRYQISNLGRVKSVLRFVKNKHSERRVNECFLSPKRCTNGYLCVNLGSNRKSKMLNIHRLVALHFLGFENQHLTVNHIDGNKENNCLSNLEFVTQKENNHHKIHVLKLDRRPDIRGEKNPMYGRKHSEETKRKISNALRRHI